MLYIVGSKLWGELGEQERKWVEKLRTNIILSHMWITDINVYHILTYKWYYWVDIQGKGQI